MNSERIGPFDGTGKQETETATRVLSLSTVYPRPDEPNLGLFVRSRLEHIARAESSTRLMVVAPLAAIDYSRRRSGNSGSLSTDYRDTLPVLRPRWLYPPGGGPLNPFFLFARLLAPLARLRKGFPFQLIDAHFGYPEGVAAWLLARAFRCPFTVTLRGNETMHGEHRLRRALIGRSLRGANRVITVSNRLREYAVSLGADSEKVKTIPNGVNSAVYYPHDRNAMRVKHDIPVDTPVILSAGYLVERKGHHRALSALRELRTGGLPAKLLIAGGPGGEGRYQEHIEHLITSLRLEKEVRMLGEVSQETLSELMSAADVFCLASSREGWPNVVHEALSCGTPVVVTDVGAAREMVPSEEHGFVVPPGDEPALASALRRALLKTWNREAIAARAQSRSWEKVAQEVLEEFHQVIEGAK